MKRLGGNSAKSSGGFAQGLMEPLVDIFCDLFPARLSNNPVAVV